MLDSILRWSLRLRGLVAVLALACLGVGAWLLVRAKIDVLPDLDRPVVTVLTDVHGMVTEDVERLVTRPIERALLGAPRVERVRSSSSHGFSTVSVDFEWAADLYLARQIVTERLQNVREALPGDAEPSLGPVASVMGQIQLVGFQADEDGLSSFEIRRFVDREVVPRLEAIPGVSQVISLGGQAAEVTVAADAAALRAHGVTLVDLAAAVESAGALGAGGVVRQGSAGVRVAPAGLVRDPREIGDAILGAPTDAESLARAVRVRDVATVGVGPSAVRTGDAGIDGEAGVIVVVTKQPGLDTRSVTAAVDREIEALRPSLPAGVRASTDLFRQSAFIDRAIGNVIDAVRDGALLVVLVLVLLLMEVRTTLITLSAIPMALAMTAIAFELFGLSINTMTLGGIAVAIGTLVDDAIVDVENVYRRLRENSTRDAPRPVLEVVYRAASEVRLPVVYGTLVMACVYVPLFFLSGIEGRLFAPVGIAFTVSVVSSTVVALTLTPVLCYWLLGGVRAKGTGEHSGPVARVLRGLARACAAASTRWPTSVAALATAFVALAAIETTRLGTSFLPPFQEGSAQVNLSLPPGTDLATSAAYGVRLEKVIRNVGGVRSVARRTGREPGDKHAMPISVSEAIVVLDPDLDRSREDVLGDIRDAAKAEFPGVPIEVEQPLGHLLSHLLSGVTAQVAIKIAGVELDVLHGLQSEVEAIAGGVDGVTDLYATPLVRVPQLDIVPDREALARLGVRATDVARTVELAMGMEPVDAYYEDRVVLPVVVGLAHDDRRGVRDLEGLEVPAASGKVLLRDVASVRRTAAPTAIDHENGARLAVVRHNVSGRALGDVAADLERALEPVRRRIEALPGYRLEIGGQFQAQREASRMIAWTSLIAALLIVLVLRAHFGSLRTALLVLVTRPFAFVGGVAAVSWTGQSLSIAALVGFIAVFGFATRNAILLVDRALALARDGGGRVDAAAAIRAAEERVVPVLMTALTSGIGVVPLALAAGEPGKELLYPVATVLLGGLVTTTLLDFVVLPGLMLRFLRAPAATRE